MLDSYEIKPYTQMGTIAKDRTDNLYPLEMVLPVLGMNEYFVKKVIGKQEYLTEDMIVKLLEQDAFSETFVPRSKVLTYLRKEIDCHLEQACLINTINKIYKGDAIPLIDQLDDNSIQCVVTSTL